MLNKTKFPKLNRGRTENLSRTRDLPNPDRKNGRKEANGVDRGERNAARDNRRDLEEKGRRIAELESQLWQ